MHTHEHFDTHGLLLMRLRLKGIAAHLVSALLYDRQRMSVTLTEDSLVSEAAAFGLIYYTDGVLCERQDECFYFVVVDRFTAMSPSSLHLGLQRCSSVFLI